MALSPENPNTFMREVDDAVRADRMESFVRDYGKWVVALVAAGLIGFAGWLYWQNSQVAASGGSGRTFGAAIEAMGAGRPKAASDQVVGLARGEDPTYRALALMVQGNSALAQGQVNVAAARFGAVANDAAVPQAMRNAALLRQTLAEFDSLPPETIVARLRALVATPGPAFASAAELTALAELRRGNDRAAGLLFKRIAETAGVADGLKSRALQMASTLGADVVRPATPTTTTAAAAATPATKTGE